MSTRVIGALIMVHGDDSGLVIASTSSQKAAYRFSI